MTDYESVARQRLTLVSDNRHPNMPRPDPWYLRWAYFASVVAAALFGLWVATCVLFSFG